jgi:hypothetical protein
MDEESKRSQSGLRDGLQCPCVGAGSGDGEGKTLELLVRQEGWGLLTGGDEVHRGRRVMTKIFGLKN